MRHDVAKLKSALSDSAERAHLLEEVRAWLRQGRDHFGFSRRQMELLDEQLQAPPMHLYENGSLEIVAPAVGTEKGAAVEWLDLEVRIVAEQGTSDANAGAIVWSLHDSNHS